VASSKAIFAARELTTDELALLVADAVEEVAETEEAEEADDDALDPAEEAADEVAPELATPPLSAEEDEPLPPPPPQAASAANTTRLPAIDQYFPSDFMFPNPHVSLVYVPTSHFHEVS
jgi:predicted component of type VI protein secretion system